jgi:hypothetical protein
VHDGIRRHPSRIRPWHEHRRTGSDSKHSFSFAGYYDPSTHHGLPLVNNDDVAAGRRF